MIIGIIAALAGHLSNAFAALADKYLLKRAFQEPAVYVVWIGIISLLVFVLLPFDFALPATATQWLTDLLAGALFSLALLAYFNSLKRSELSAVVPVVGSVTAIVTVIISYLYLAERFSFYQILGILVLIVAFWLLTYEGKMVHRSALPYTIVAAVLFSFSAVVMKVVFFNQPFISGLAFSRVGSLLVSLVLITSPIVRKAILASAPRFRGGNLLILIGDHIAGAVSFVLLNFGIAASSPAIVNALQGSQYAFLYLLVGAAGPFAPTVFKEDVSGVAKRRRLIGIAVVAIGIALIVQVPK